MGLADNHAAVQHDAGREKGDGDDAAAERVST